MLVARWFCQKKEGLPEEKGVLYGEVPDRVPITENGLKLETDLKNGQKTGYYLDQKENRFALRRFARGDVLDCFCNSGGFSLNAALSARKVIAVDASDAALKSVQLNAELNGFANIEMLCSDVFDLLRVFRGEGRSFDTLILDPPAFCKSATEVKDACKGYLDLNTLGMKLVRPGGYLMTCSCTHFVSIPIFEKTIAEAARRAGRRVKIVESRSQAPDHPILLGAEETQYLKCLILRVE